MKWAHVEDFVFAGTGIEAIAAREGLGSQALVVTDPMRHARAVDLSMAASGLPAAPLANILFAGDEPTGGTAGPPTSGLRQLQVGVRTYVFDQVVRTSGLGLLAIYMGDSQRGDVGENYAADSMLRDDPIAPITASLNGSLNKVARLASKATALALPITDPDHPGRTRVYARLAPYIEVYRFGIPAPMVAQASLEVIAERRLVVDEGHDELTKLTARLRDLAETYATGPYFDRERAFTDLGDRRRRADGPVRGFVRSGDDARELRLQVADVLAGWGRTLIARYGYRELQRCISKVVYNGQPLTAELAATLDRERRDHDNLMTGYGYST